MLFNFTGKNLRIRIAIRTTESLTTIGRREGRPMLNRRTTANSASPYHRRDKSSENKRSFIALHGNQLNDDRKSGIESGYFLCVPVDITNTYTLWGLIPICVVRDIDSN